MTKDSMIPPLKPRPRPTPGAENDLPSTLNAMNKATAQAGLLQKRRRGGNNPPIEDAPLSPPFAMEASTGQQLDDSLVQTPEQQVPQQDTTMGQLHKNLLVDYSFSSASSADTSMSTGSSATNVMSSPSDLILTPPQATTMLQQTSMAVAAKRHGNELREANNSENRRRRRRLTAGAEVQSVLVQATSGGNNHQASTKTSNTPMSSCDDEEEDEYSWWNVSRADGKSPYDDEEEDDDTPLELLTGNSALIPPEERTKKYWEWCYGNASPSALSGQVPVSGIVNGFSARRAPPLKGCLSNPRPRRPTTAFSTPTDSPEEDMQRKRQAAERAKRGFRVQFGSPSAVEYNIDACPQQLTPMPEQKVRDKYSMTPIEPTQEEEEMTLETKQNNAILSEWDDMDNHKHKKDSHRRSGRNSGRKRNRRHRRESSIFSPSADLARQDNQESISNDARNDSLEIEQKSLEQRSVGPVKSPSVLLSDSLESMQMSPRAASPSTATGTNVDSEEATWEFAVNLGSIHSSGAACDTSMNASFDSVNPLDTMANNTLSCLQQEMTTSPSITNEAYDPETNSDELFCAITSLAKGVLVNSQVDQQYSIVPVLHHLAASPTSEDTDVSDAVLGVMDPFFENIRPCIDALVEKARSSRAPTAKYPTKAKAREAVQEEWKSLECKFFASLTTGMLEADRRFFQHLSLHAKNAVEARTRSELLLEVLLLEQEIEKEVEEMALMEAALAPISVTLGEATNWVSLLGFDLEVGDNERIFLKWHHLEVAETTVVFPLDTIAELTIQPTILSSRQDFPEIDNLYRLCLNQAPKVVSGLEIDESLLRLSRWLATLDHIAELIQRLPEVIDTLVLLQENSQVLLSFRAKGETLRVTLELCSFLIGGVSFETAEGPLSIEETKEFNGNALQDSMDAMFQRYFNMA